MKIKWWKIVLKKLNKKSKKTKKEKQRPWVTIYGP